VSDAEPGDDGGVREPPQTPPELADTEEAAQPHQASKEAPPAPKKKKKKRKKTEAPREGVPPFARSFPRDPVLDALVDAFERGDYARVRREAPKLASEADRDDVRDAARELARRIDPDPLAVYLLAGAAALLAFLAAWYWAHVHTP
jgi:hypothetical protein